MTELTKGQKEFQAKRDFCTKKCGDNYCNLMRGRGGYPCVEYICAFCDHSDDPKICYICAGGVIE